MEESLEPSYKSKYQDIRKEYLEVKRKYDDIISAYEQLQAINSQYLDRVNEISIDNDLLRAKLLKAEKGYSYTVTNNHINEFAKTICSKQTPVIFSPIPTPNNSGECLQVPTAKKTLISNRAPQANPDQSIHYEVESNIIEAFVIVGVSAEKLDDEYVVPEIIWEYSHEASVLNHSVRTVLPDFCFPEGIVKRELKVTASMSELNKLLYGQVATKRGNNCYTFTIRSTRDSRDSLEYGEMPNSSQEILYGLCIQIEDLMSSVDSECDWVVPKCYCLLTHVPLFEFHYEFMSSVLLLKRLFRMELVRNDLNCPKRTFTDLSEQLMSQKEEELVVRYSECDSFAPGEEIVIQGENLDPITYTCPEDLSFVDIVWHCCPLMSSLKFEDLFWILTAAMQEKSVFFVSRNMGLVSSCVLGLHALMRPFVWPNILVPLIPDKLLELIESPVPILGGLLGGQEHCERNSEAVWVLLDDPCIKKRLRASHELKAGVEELSGGSLKKELKMSFSAFRDKSKVCFYPTPSQSMAAEKFATRIREFWDSIGRSVRKLESHRIYKRIAKELNLKKQAKFLKAFCKTQMFNTFFIGS